MKIYIYYFVTKKITLRNRGNAIWELSRMGKWRGSGGGVGEGDGEWRKVVIRRNLLREVYKDSS